MGTKFLIFAGCTSEGQVLNGQPYSGPVDCDSIVAFALDTLRNSPYHSSNIAFGLAELDFELALNEDGIATFTGYDSVECFNGCDDGECQCEPDSYWVTAQLAE